MTADALSSHTAKLPLVALAPPPRVIGKGTVDSIQAGLFYGYLCLVEGITRRILGELGRCTVVATGGFANTFASHSEAIDLVDLDLTLKGIRLIWERARGSSR